MDLTSPKNVERFSQWQSLFGVMGFQISFLGYEHASGPTPNRRSKQLFLQAIVLNCAFPEDREHFLSLLQGRPLQTFTCR